MPLSEYEQEYYKDILEQEVPVETPTEEAPITENPVAEESPIAEETPVTEQPKAEETKPWQPEFKKETDKYIYEKLAEGDEKSVYEILHKKYHYESLTDEQKAMAFIAAQNPELDEDELSFLAATEYGIGSEKIPEDELTDDQIIALKKQSIGRKRLIKEAGIYFTDQATKVELPVLPTDPDYVQYKENLTKQAEQQEKNKIAYETTLKTIETNAKSINEVKESIEIDIDGGKLPFDVNFKLDENKQQDLIDYVKNYTPTEAEVRQFTDTQTGKFDYKGYLQSQAIKVFPKEFMAAAIKQALAKDREQFIEKELKNSTLRNNDISETVDKPFDLALAWPFGK